MPGPHRRGHERSLGRGFPAGPPSVRGPVRPAFALALYGGVLTRLSRALGTPDTFSGVCRPSRTAHLALSPGVAPGLGIQPQVSGVSWSHPPAPEDWFHRSRLRYAPAAVPQRQAAVKLHGVFSPHRDSQDSAPGCGFSGSRAGTVGTSLIHSCAPELTRQGIWLP